MTPGEGCSIWTSSGRRIGRTALLETGAAGGLPEGLSDVLGWISADEALRTLASTGEFDLGALQIKPMPFVLHRT